MSVDLATWRHEQHDDLFYDADIDSTDYLQSVTPAQARADLIGGLSAAELTILQHATDRRLL